MNCEFGSTSKGEKARLYILRNQRGMEIAVTDYGAALVKVLVPDKDGKVQDVVLGYDNAKAYENGGVYFGATVGRVANRIGGASFELNGNAYELTANDNNNSLHGGRDYYNKRMWQAEETDGQKVMFSLESPEGDQGYPGNAKISVIYELTEDNELKISYHAVSDGDTLMNLTNHSYFNLRGQDGGSIEDHVLWLKASGYTPTAAGSIPTGEIAPVKGTPMDFTTAKMIGEEIGAEFEQLQIGGGYDHNWVLDDVDGQLRLVAKVTAPGTSRAMKVYTTLPGIQFYAGNFIGEQDGKSGVKYHNRCGLALETQFFPDSIHKDNFPDAVFGPDRQYTSSTVYRFCNA